MKKSVPFLAALFTLSTSLFFAKSTSQVFAQTTPAPTIAVSSLTAIPPRLGEDLSLKVKPGEKIQTSVRVRNGSSEAMTVKSLAQDFIVDLGGDTPVPVEDAVSNRWSLASWVLLTPSVQEVQPGEIAIVNVIIDVPADALPGGHYAMITHQPVTGSDTLQGKNSGQTPAATLQQRVGTLLYVTVEGPINESAFIRELNFPKFSEYGPVPFSFTVDNQSDIHIRPQIGIEIYNLFGKKIDTIDLPTKNIFPFIARDFKGNWDRIWGFGPYTAKVVMSYGSTGQMTIVVSTFWLLPITILLAAVIILISLLAIVILVRRHLQYRRNDQQAQIEMLAHKVNQLEQEKLEQFDN